MLRRSLWASMSAISGVCQPAQAWGEGGSDKKGDDVARTSTTFKQ